MSFQSRKRAPLDLKLLEKEGAVFGTPPELEVVLPQPSGMSSALRPPPVDGAPLANAPDVCRMSNFELEEAIRRYESHMRTLPLNDRGVKIELKLQELMREQSRRSAIASSMDVTQLPNIGRKSLKMERDQDYKTPSGSGSKCYRAEGYSHSKADVESGASQKRRERTLVKSRPPDRNHGLVREVSGSQAANSCGYSNDTIMDERSTDGKICVGKSSLNVCNQNSVMKMCKRNENKNLNQTCRFGSVANELASKRKPCSKGTNDSSPSLGRNGASPFPGVSSSPPMNLESSKKDLHQGSVGLSAARASSRRKCQISVTGASPDTAMELSDDEDVHVVKDCTTLLEPPNGHFSKRQGLRSQKQGKEFLRIAYPSRNDPDAVEVKYSDLEYLHPCQFLNDTVIDFYIKYIQRPENMADEKRAKVHFFNSFFFKKLTSGEKKKPHDNFTQLRKWTKGINIFEKSYLMMPVHDSAHWSLAVVCFDKVGDSMPCGAHILHLDSMESGHCSNDVFQTLKRYLEMEWKDSAFVNMNGGSRKYLPVSFGQQIKVPLQDNAWDCGLFLLFYIRRFVEEARFPFKATDLHTMCGAKWFKPREASHLREEIRELLVSLFKSESMQTENCSKPDVARVLLNDQC